jgi:hypothetical protein
LLIICAGLLLVALANLPIGYYTFLRIVVTIGAIAVVVSEIQNELNFWVVIFGVIAILFNPLIPVHLNAKETWLPIDIVVALVFLIKSLKTKKNKEPNF